MNINDVMKYLDELNILSISVRLIFAAIFGALLGIDRARKHRPAGFRTHMLVCIGSALIMITNQYLNISFGSGDPARLGAQVISGIGFLGAGTIILTRRNQVLGLTTAAGLWADACIGLAIGAGFYSGAIIGGLIILFIVVVMSGADEHLQQYSKYLQIYAEFKDPSTLSLLLGFASQNGIKINDIEIVESKHSQAGIGAIIQFKLPEKADHELVIDQFRNIGEISFITKL